MLNAMTTDPAMLLWLSGSGSTKEAPNENYAREMQELFTLGAGEGYSERDVREHARALTGWTNTWNSATGEQENFHFDPALHDDGVKTIYGKRGRFAWRDSVRLVLDHPDHPRHFVTKLWSYFCPEPLSAADTRAAQHLYVSSGKRIRPVVEAMLMHPLIHDGPRMVKPPIVQIAGMLRGIGRYIDTDAWAWESSLVGQMPFYPPNVAGWEAERWLNTGTWLARFNLCSQMIDEKRVIKAQSNAAKTACRGPQGAHRGGARLLGRARPSAPHPAALHLLRQVRRGGFRHSVVGARAVPNARAERSARARRRHSRVPDMLKGAMTTVAVESNHVAVGPDHAAIEPNRGAQPPHRGTPE